MRVEGCLSFDQIFAGVAEPDPIVRLPEGLEAVYVSLKGRSRVRSLPNGMRIERLVLDDCSGLEALPEDLECGSLSANRTKIRSVPAGPKVSRVLQMRECPALTTLPGTLKVETLDFEGSRALEVLPDQVECSCLNAGSTMIRSVPQGVRVSEVLSLRGCSNLTTLPNGLCLKRLDLAGCTELETLPEDLEVKELSLWGCARFRRWPRCGPPSLDTLVLRGCTALTDLPGWLMRVGELDVNGSGIPAEAVRRRRVRKLTPAEPSVMEQEWPRPEGDTRA